MADYKSLNSALKNVESNISKAKKSAGKRAGTSGRASLAKEVSADIGLASAKIKKRVKLYKANEEGVVMSVGTARFVEAQSFKPKSEKVQSTKGKRIGASFQVKGQSRIIAKGAFLAKGKSSGKTVMIQRKGGARYPTMTTLIDVFTGAVLKAKATVQKAMSESFKKNFERDLAFRTKK